MYLEHQFNTIYIIAKLEIFYQFYTYSQSFQIKSYQIIKLFPPWSVTRIRRVIKNILTNCCKQKVLNEILLQGANFLHG